MLRVDGAMSDAHADVFADVSLAEMMTGLCWRGGGGTSGPRWGSRSLRSGIRPFNNMQNLCTSNGIVRLCLRSCGSAELLCQFHRPHCYDVGRVEGKELSAGRHIPRSLSLSVRGTLLAIHGSALIIAR